MAQGFLDDLKNTALQNGASIAPQTLTAVATTNGTAVDCDLTDGAITMQVVTGETGDATLVLNAKLQESDTSGGTYTDVVEGAIAPITGATAGDNRVVMVSTRKRTKRFCRAVVTLAGAGTLSVAIAAFITGRLRITGTGTGHQT